MEFFLKGSLPQGQTSKNWPVTLFTNRYCSIWLYDNENPERNDFKYIQSFVPDSLEYQKIFNKFSCGIPLIMGLKLKFIRDWFKRTKK